MQMETDFETVSRLLMLTDQMRLAQADPMLSFPRGEIADMREAISRIRIEGLFLDEAELDDLRKTLSFAVELENFFEGLDDQKYALLKELSTINCQLSTINCQLSTVNYQLSTTQYPVPTWLWRLS